MTIIDRARTEVHLDVEAVHGRGILTPRKRRMVDAYVSTGNIAEAARASGFAQSTVKKYINEDPHIRKAVGVLVDQAALVTGVTLERVIAEYAKIAFADIADFLSVLKSASDPELALLALGELPAEMTAAISEITLDMTPGTEDKPPTGKLKLKLHDKKSALQDLARMLQMFNDTLTIKDETGYGLRLRRAIAKLDEETPPDGA